ncbi:MAG TPA: diacylglycerol kinase family protein [Gemmatimonadales bacterium]|nr:diacylglycerol kinase family protein [Gemmatimonadales bacterium]
MATVAVILNAASGDGRAEQVGDRLGELFAAAGRPLTVTLAHDVPELQRGIDAAVSSGAAALVAGGGDGTINLAAAALIGTDIPLGVLPLGTLNHFAKDLGLPLDLDEAAAVVLAGFTMKVDVGEVNGTYFLNNSSLGLYPRMVRLRAAHPARGWRKWAVALWAMVKTLERNPKISVAIDTEGSRVVTRTSIVFIGNNEYEMSGLEAGTRATLRGGRLAIYLTRGGGRPRLMRLAWRMFTGRAFRSGELEVILTDTASISLHHAQASVALDGEVVVLTTPLTYRIRPAALRVLVPGPVTAAS